MYFCGFNRPRLCNRPYIGNRNAIFSVVVLRARWLRKKYSPISVHGHSGSNPSNVPDRHTCVSYWHSIQTLAVSHTVCEIFDLKVGLFDAPLSQVFEKTGRFWTVTMTFSERYNSLDVIAEKIFQKSLIVSSQRAKTWRPGRKFDRNFDVFWPLWPGFWTFQKSPSSV